MVCLRPYLSLIVCPYDSLLRMLEIWNLFTVLGGNNSDLADMSVLLMTETLD